MPELIAGKYEILETIGRGGMGTVYKAVQRSLDRIVAIKMLSEELASDPEFRGRFQQEATVVARLNHPSIVAVFDIEPHNHTFCIIMEYLEGENLQSKIDRDVSLPERDIVRIGAQVARALAYAHSQGIIHRDIKPDNVHVTPKGVAKVMDFGIARFLDSKLKTQTGISMGTPKFMSPEQVTGKNVDGQTDLYSLGICLYYCLAGRPPFDGENAISVATRHLYEQPEPPSRFNTSITPAVEKVIMKALEKQKNARYLTGTEMADALEATLGIKTPIRLAEEKAAEVYSGATQRIAVPRYGVEGSDEDGKQAVPAQGARPEPPSATASDTSPMMTPLSVRQVPGLHDFQMPVTATPTDAGSANTMRYGTWWLLGAAFIATMCIFIAVLLTRYSGENIDVPGIGPVKQELTDRGAMEAVQKEADDLADRGHILEAQSAWLDFKRDYPYLETAAVDDKIDLLGSQLPVSEVKPLVKRREQRGNFYLLAAQTKDAIAYAYLRSAQQLDPTFRRNAMTSNTMWQLERRLVAVPSDESKEAARRIMESARSALTDPSKKSQAEPMLLNAANADYKEPEYWVALGDFYKEGGKKDDARVMYGEALQHVTTGTVRADINQRLNGL